MSMPGSQLRRFRRGFGRRFRSRIFEPFLPLTVVRREPFQITGVRSWVAWPRTCDGRSRAYQGGRIRDDRRLLSRSFKASEFSKNGGISRMISGDGVQISRFRRTLGMTDRRPGRRRLDIPCRIGKARMASLDPPPGSPQRPIPEMSVARRPPHSARLLRFLPAVFVLALMAAGEVSASPTPDDHAAVCKCGMHCRPGACCCGPKKPAPRPEPEPKPSDVPIASPDESSEPSGPCLGAAPCGDDVAAPVKTATARTGKAAIAGFRPRPSSSRGDRLPPPTSDDCTSSIPSPLDRPPKADPSA